MTWRTVRRPEPPISHQAAPIATHAEPAQAPSVDARLGRRLRLLVAASLLAHLTVPFVLPLTGEEAYYWHYGRHPDLCFFDHPPLVGWTLSVVNDLLGHTVFAVRLVALLAHVATLAVVVRLAKAVTGDDTKALAAGASFTLSLLFAASGFLTLPDSLLFLGWSAALLAAVEAARSGRGAWWLVAGAALCFAGLAKFHAVFAALALGAAALLDPVQRRRLLSPWGLGMVVLAGACLVPVLLWQLRHDGLTFSYQFVERQRDGGLVYVLESVLGPLAFVGPLLGPLAVVGAWRALRRHADFAGRLLALALWVPWLFFVAWSLGRRVDAQWAAPGFLSGVVLAASVGVDWARDAAAPAWRRRALSAALTLNAALLGLVVVAAVALVAVPSFVPQAGRLLAHRREFDVRYVERVRGWDQVGARVASEIEALGGPDRAYVHMAKGYGTLASVQFYASAAAPDDRPAVRGYLFDARPWHGKQYDVLRRSADLRGQHAVIVAQKTRYVADPETGAFLPALRDAYERIEWQEDLVVTAGGVEQRRYRIARAWNLSHDPFPWPGDEDTHRTSDAAHRESPANALR